jgi:LacI family transcriptional regulator
MPSRGRATMADIARSSGVSLTTVSLVLRDKPGVGPEKRQRVQQVARDLGYVLRSPTTPSSLQMANIGLIVKSEPAYVPQANPFYSRVLAGIETACRQRQANLLYATMPVDADSYPLELPRILVEEGAVDGLLLVGAFLNEPLAQVVKNHSAPIVLVDAYATTKRYDAVVSDNFRGGYRAALHLMRQGHRHIGIVGSHPQAYPSIRERQQGYIQALADSDLSQEYVAECHITDTGELVGATTRLLHQHPQVTAILAANDETALAVMDAARELGRQIPQDLSIVGFDDIDLAARVSPPLTTMHVDKAGMGRMAVQLLVNRIEYPESSPVTAAVRPHLVERDSVRTLEVYENTPSLKEEAEPWPKLPSPLP